MRAHIHTHSQSKYSLLAKMERTRHRTRFSGPSESSWARESRIFPLYNYVSRVTKWTEMEPCRGWGALCKSIGVPPDCKRLCGSRKIHHRRRHRGGDLYVLKYNSPAIDIMLMTMISISLIWISRYSSNASCRRICPSYLVRLARKRKSGVCASRSFSVVFVDSSCCVLEETWNLLTISI